MIAFIRGWLVTLVMLSSIPLMVISGGVMSLLLSKMASRGQEAYAKAATLVEQTIGSIRTVSSLLTIFCFHIIVFLNRIHTDICVYDSV